jgi:hypothetical protein
VFYLVIFVMKLVIFYLPLLHMILTNHILFFRMRSFVHALKGKGKKDVSSSSRSQGKKNDGSASSDRPSLFRGSSSHLSRRSALQRCLDEAMQVSHM